MMDPTGGGIDLVFSFDTTGSMSRVIDEVKGRVQDMIQRLQADIPNIRIGVIAHGDYCDKDVFYLEQHVDLSTDIVELTNFVQNVDGTGGGDPEECYEYILRLSRGLSWAPHSQRALVVIGDSVPHEANYDLNTERLDWRKEASALQEMRVKIYGVQAFEEAASTAFFQELTAITCGEHLKLGDFSNICDFIMAICYRERGAEYLEDYEVEVRAREARTGLHKDLEGLFGVLKRGDSGASSKVNDLMTSLTSTSTATSVSAMGAALPSLITPVASPASSSSGHSLLIATPLSASTASTASPSSTKPSKPTRRQRTKQTGNKTTPVLKTVKPSRAVGKGAQKQKQARIKSSKKADSGPVFRHTVPTSKCVLGKKSLSRRWSNWKVIMAASVSAADLDKKVFVLRKGMAPGFCRAKIFPRDKHNRKGLYEISMQKSRGKGFKKYVVFMKLCTLPRSKNWERTLFRNAYIKRHLDAVLRSASAVVYARRFLLQGLGKRQKELVTKYQRGGFYKYLWSAKEKFPKRLSWAMDTS